MSIGILEQVDDRVAALRCVENQMRAAQAGKLRAVYEVLCEMGADLSTIDGDAAVAEVACLLHLSHRSAQRLADDALSICARTHIFDALERGDIDLTRAKIIESLLPTDDLQEQFEDFAIFYATDHTRTRRDAGSFPIFPRSMREPSARVSTRSARWAWSITATG